MAESLRSCSILSWDPALSNEKEGNPLYCPFLQEKAGQFSGMLLPKVLSCQHVVLRGLYTVRLALQTLWLSSRLTREK